MKPILAAAFAVFLAAPAYAASGGPCNEPYVLLTIQRDFAKYAADYPGIDATIRRMGHGKLMRSEPKGEALSSVERHYCHARASLSDGERRDVWFLVERNMSFAGLGTHVEFCVAGLDPWRIYGADCRSLR